MTVLSIWNLKASSIGNHDIPNSIVDSENKMGMDLTVLSDAVTSAEFKTHFVNSKQTLQT